MTTTTTIAFLLCLASVTVSSHARSTPSLKPKALDSLEINDTKVVESCSYTIEISTSCSSPPFTRDRVGISFGDAYGNQVYLPSLDYPRSSTFDRCTSDRFTITGQCTYQVCYLYLYRSGHDGWIPGTVTVYGYYTKWISFDYHTLIPNNKWYGFNLCNEAESASA